MKKFFFVLFGVFSVSFFTSCKMEHIQQSPSAGAETSRLKYFDLNVSYLPFKDLPGFSSRNIGVGYGHDGENAIYIVNADKLEKYDVAKGQWSILSEAMIPAMYTSAEVVNNMVYSFNGYIRDKRANNSKVLIYDLANHTFRYGAENPHPSNYAGSAVWDNKIYTFGGSAFKGKSPEYQSEVHVYDITTDSWSFVTHLPEAKQTEGEIVNGKLYVFGGFNGAGSQRLDVYDIATDSWEYLGKLPFACSAQSTTVDGDKIWIVGSYDKQDLIASFNTKTNELKTFKNNMTERRHAGSAVINNKLYVFGGGQTAYPDSFLNSLQSTDIAGL